MSLTISEKLHEKAISARANARESFWKDVTTYIRFNLDASASAGKFEVELPVKAAIEYALQGRAPLESEITPDEIIAFSRTLLSQPEWGKIKFATLEKHTAFLGCSCKGKKEERCDTWMKISF